MYKVNLKMLKQESKVKVTVHMTFSEMQRLSLAMGQAYHSVEKYKEEYEKVMKVLTKTMVNELKSNTEEPIVWENLQTK